MRLALGLTLSIFVACAHAPAPAPVVPVALPTPPLCEHHVPAAECTRCHPELVAEHQARHDWCEAHQVPETQCLECHPGTIFVVQPPIPKDADYRFLSTMGEDVPALEPHAIAGKVTLFDFYGPWCGACRNVEAHVATLLGARADLAVRRLNIQAWDSPLAERWLKTIPALPYVVVYGRDGARVGAISGLDLEALDAAIARGAAR